MAAPATVVSETDLLLTMPDRYAHIVNEQYSKQIVALPADFNVQPWERYLYWHAGVEHDPANAWLRTQIRAAEGDHHVRLKSPYSI
jgi:DNA-binding transcriptional LysR family regulator